MDLPALNACLNGVAATCLLAGYACIRRGWKRAHRAAMLSALGASTVFLAGYVLHKFQRGGVHTPFGGEGAVRTLYYGLLASHVLLAMAILPLVFITLRPALRGDEALHRRRARVTFPIWLYVSATGVLVYFFLYVWWPAAPR